MRFHDSTFSLPSKLCCRHWMVIIPGTNLERSLIRLPLVFAVLLRPGANLGGGKPKVPFECGCQLVRGAPVSTQRYCNHLLPASPPTGTYPTRTPRIFPALATTPEYEVAVTESWKDHESQQSLDRFSPSCHHKGKRTPVAPQK